MGIVESLQRARSDLLDLSARNRLLNTPRRRSRSKTLEIVDELSVEIFRIFVDENKAMSFLPAAKEEVIEEFELDDESLFSDLSLPEEGDTGQLAARHTDKYLQTLLTSENLQKRLLGLFYDARTYEEEQGVNILFLALGFLKWFEDDNSDRERYAPLILVPVVLDRGNVGDRFKLRYLGDELSTNLSLQMKLKLEFGITLPDLPDFEELDPTAYFGSVRSAIEGQNRWQVLENDILLGFFSFSKFLMYRDLDPENWPEHVTLTSHPILTSLLEDGFGVDQPLFGENDRIDDLIAPSEMVHVVDADSSQTIAIEEVKNGRSLVIQGPPGTGKSQTITNLIAASVKAGKKILFVAEKMAALDVVKHRLENIGLGEMCLELHSHKANKKHVLEDLKHTLDLLPPKVEDVESHYRELQETRDSLNDHAAMLHSPLEPSGLTPYRVIGELVHLQAREVSPPGFALGHAAEWSRDTYRSHLNLISQIADQISDVGPPAENPWRGVGLSAVLPSDVARIRDHLGDVLKQVEALQTLSRDVAAHLNISEKFRLGRIDDLAGLSRHAADVPMSGKECFANPVWRARSTKISELVDTGKRLLDIREALNSKVSDIAWTTDVADARRDLSAHGGSFFRFLNGRYRSAQAVLKSLLIGAPPKPLQDRLTILDGIIAAQRAERELNDQATTGRNAFGSLWNGPKSDWSGISALVEWEVQSRQFNLPDNFLKLVATTTLDDRLRALSDEILGCSLPLLQELDRLFGALQLDLAISFGTESKDHIFLEDLRSRLREWLNDIEGLSKWIGLRIRLEAANEQGLSDLTARLWDGRILPEEAVDQFQYAYFEAIMRHLLDVHPSLASFDGQTHSQVLRTFQSLDKERITLARQEVAQSHYDQIPRSGGAGEIGLVRREIEKKRRHLPLRKLMRQTGTTIQSIKPVFMMSPMSVAQFLEPGGIEFDLLLIDEASQVRPVDALGAIARTKQIIVVGDDKQLPPTRFFARGMGDGGDEEEDAEGVVAGDLESILGLCSAQGVPNRMLRWHYRSRHESLIAVSNHEFYDDRLFIVPSAHAAGPTLGVVFHHVSDGVYDRGGSATNAREARVVAVAVIEHARQYPDLTLGVGTFSLRQKEAILNELEHLWRTETDVRDFFASGAGEPFFVKNLESIQGDERDVIMISVCYGPDRHGYFSMNFGPLSSEGGERRLNVLISRARRCCRVFSSITADQIDLNRAKGRGVAAFKTYLNFAQTGKLSVAMPTGKDFDSPFEEEVSRAVQRLGHEVEPQVGIAGFFVDLAIVDPEVPGRYLLGIECDGAAYHSARSARDRDRLRQQVLEDHGWIIHRVWSTDWFHRPEEQLRKIVAAIERAKTEISAASQPGPQTVRASENKEAHTIEREVTEGLRDYGKSKIEVLPYSEASFSVDTTLEPHEVSSQTMAEIVTRIVREEGPIHRDEVARRVSSLWGFRRTGSRISLAVNAGLSIGDRSKSLSESGDFYDVPDRRISSVRNRSHASSSTLRKPDMLPPSEIRFTIGKVVEAYIGIEPDEAAIEVTRLFGFKATSAPLRDVITLEIRSLLDLGPLRQQDGKLYLDR